MPTRSDDDPGSRRPYTVLVLRLVTDEAREGRLVGLAELVETGERATVRGPSDLLALACDAPHPSPVSDSRFRGIDGVLVAPVAEVAQDESPTAMGRP